MNMVKLFNKSKSKIRFDTKIILLLYIQIIAINNNKSSIYYDKLYSFSKYRGQIKKIEIH